MDKGWGGRDGNFRNGCRACACVLGHVASGRGMQVAHVPWFSVTWFGQSIRKKCIMLLCIMLRLQTDVTTGSPDMGAQALRFLPHLPPHVLANMLEIGG